MGHIRPKSTIFAVTFATGEINDFWDKILNPQIFAVSNLVPEHFFVDPNPRYALYTDTKFGQFGTYRTLAPHFSVTLARNEINEFWGKIMKA